MIDRRQVDRLVGESLREVGVLVLVFAPPDTLFEPVGPATGTLALLILGSLSLIGLGVIVEAWIRA